MPLQLIPVFQLEYKHRSVQRPLTDDEQTFYEYKLNILKACGFDDNIQSIDRYGSLFTIQSLTDHDLCKILRDIIKHDKLLNGGYVLFDQEKYLPLLLPRCCGDLSDITSWLNLKNKNTTGFWIGHPVVSCEITAHHVIFKEDEMPKQKNIMIAFDELITAIIKLEYDLSAIKQRIYQLARLHNLKLKKISTLFEFADDLE